MSNPLMVYNNVDRFIIIEQRITKELPRTKTTVALAQLLHDYGLSKSVQEELWVIPIDAHASVRSIYAVAKGGYHDCDLSMATILSPVFLAATDRFALAHNHPSGDLVATAHDLNLTNRLMEAADILDLDFEDHLIMAPDGRFISLKGKHLMRKPIKVSS